MPAQTPARRNVSARELAERFGCDPSTIRRIIAEPRADYLARAQERRERVLELRAQGLTIRAIAAQLDVSVGTVHRHVKAANEAAKKPA